VRHESCLACQYAPDPVLHPLTVLTETLTPRAHHHHAMVCESCGAWWFDDIVIGGLGVPVPARRDTVMCSCPDDKEHLYTRSVINVTSAEADCCCTASKVDTQAVHIRSGRGQR
jgi:hypothetical protein